MTTPKVGLKVSTLPLAVVRSMVVGEILTNWGFARRTVESVQIGFAEGLIDKLVVYGVDHNRHIRDAITYSVRPESGDTKISINTREGVSMIESLDVAFGGAVAYAVNVMRRKGLKPEAWHWWATKIASDPAALAAAKKRLGMEEGTEPPPTYAKGFGPKEILALIPGLDRDSRFSIETARPLGQP